MRIKTGPTRKKKHQKVLASTKGYRMTKNRLYKVAHEAMLHAGQYAYHGRKLRKRDLRKLWIIRINAAVRQTGLTYNRFIKQLKDAKIDLNRKTLSYLAVSEPKVFESIIKIVGARCPRPR